MDTEKTVTIPLTSLATIPVVGVVWFLVLAGLIGLKSRFRNRKAAEQLLAEWRRARVAK